MKRTIIEATQKLKTKVDMSRKDIQFEVGEYVMVHLNKSRLQKGVPTKLQMMRVGPCKVLAKYGHNACKVEPPTNLNISPVFNVANLVKYKGPLLEVGQNNREILEDVSTRVLPPKVKQQAEKISESKVNISTRHKIYMEHLIQWKGQSKVGH